MTAGRVGFGYDSHRLVEGRKLILGGVEVPHDRGLMGHSDADVLVHAIIDALLGAAALGDIGKHFPDTSPEYKGIDSMKLLQHTMMLIKRVGFRVINVDATVVCEKPKLAPHMDRIIENLRAAGIDDVNVKAKTNEGMDATGRQEGIAAYAICLLAVEG